MTALGLDANRIMRRVSASLMRSALDLERMEMRIGVGGKETLRICIDGMADADPEEALRGLMEAKDRRSPGMR